MTIESSHPDLVALADDVAATAEKNASGALSRWNDAVDNLSPDLRRALERSTRTARATQGHLDPREQGPWRLRRLDCSAERSRRPARCPLLPRLHHTDGDGWFTRADPARIDTQGAGRSMLIHRGGASNGAQVDTWSAGCQTIPKNLYPDFLRTLGRPPSFCYVLVNTR